MTTKPFASEHYDLAHEVPGLTLARLPVSEAARLGKAFAAIDPWRSYPYDAKHLEGYFAGIEVDAPRLGLFRDGDLAGVVGVRLNWLRGPYLQFLGVLPAHQNHRLGHAALGWLFAEAKRAGARNVFVCVSDFNGGARRLYTAHGFEAVGDLPDLVAAGQTEVLMRRIILATE